MEGSGCCVSDDTVWEFEAGTEEDHGTFQSG
jgi:hypothetical protein